ncbi:MAG: Uma2 family endonuclease [Fimbriiglobus sp.]
MSTEVPLEPQKLPLEYPFHIGTRTLITQDASGKTKFEYVPMTLEDYIHPEEEDRFLLSTEHIEITGLINHAFHYNCQDRPSLELWQEMRIDWQHPDIGVHGPDIAIFDNVPADHDRSARTLYVRDLNLKPLVIVEVTSDATRHVDFEEKYLAYQELGIPHYVIIDIAPPEGVPRSIQGFRLHRGQYQALRYAPDVGIMIPSIDMYINLTDEGVTFTNAAGVRIPTPMELIQIAETERQRADAEQQRADAEQQRADAVQQRADAERDRAEAERQRAEAERQRAEQAAALAQAERTRADDLARQLAELQAKLNQQG